MENLFGIEENIFNLTTATGERRKMKKIPKIRFYFGWSPAPPFALLEKYLFCELNGKEIFRIRII